MAGVKKYGRGSGFYFSESDLRNLETAINILNKYINAQEKMSKATAEEWQRLYDTSERYEKQLKAINYHTTDDIKMLQTKYDYMLRIYNQEKQEEKDKRRSREDEKEYQRTLDKFRRLTADDTKEHINQQEKLYKLQQRAAREISDETKNIKEKEQSTQRYIKLYDKLNSQIREQRRIEGRNLAQSNAKEDIKYGVASSLFGTTKQDVQDIKDGVYWWKFGLKIFNKAVETFSESVKQGIDANYNSTENTLSRIVASNSGGGRFGWNSGGFSASNIQGFTTGKSYSGFKQINNAITDQLSADNLYDNIANTEVMSAIADVTTKSGFGLEEAIAKGYQDTVIKYIVPYLDTTTEAFDDLEMIMPRHFKKCCSNEYNSQRTIWREPIFK